MITTVTLSTQSSLLQRQRVVTLLNPLVGAGQVVTAATAQAVIAYNAAFAAAASEVAAESARDAAQLSAGVYVDTTAGLAATVSGDYFSVPSASSDEYLILYKNNAGVADVVQTYPSAAALTTALTGAQTARTGAETAETNAEAAQAAAEVAQAAAELAQAAAEDAGYAAGLTAAVATATAQATIATTKAGEAGTSAAAAATAETNAETAQAAAEAAASVASASANVFSSVALGLAGTSSGEYFGVKQTYGDAVDVWLNSAGTAVDQQRSEPLSSGAVAAQAVQLGAAPAVTGSFPVAPIIDLNIAAMFRWNGRLAPGAGVQSPVRNMIPRNSGKIIGALSAGTATEFYAAGPAGKTTAKRLQLPNAAVYDIFRDVVIPAGPYTIKVKVKSSAGQGTANFKFGLLLGGGSMAAVSSTEAGWTTLTTTATPNGTSDTPRVTIQNDSGAAIDIMIDEVQWYLQSETIPDFANEAVSQPTVRNDVAYAGSMRRSGVFLDTNARSIKGFIPFSTFPLNKTFSGSVGVTMMALIKTDDITKIATKVLSFDGTEGTLTIGTNTGKAYAAPVLPRLTTNPAHWMPGTGWHVMTLRVKNGEQAFWLDKFKHAVAAVASPSIPVKSGLMLGNDDGATTGREFLGLYSQVALWEQWLTDAQVRQAADVLMARHALAGGAAIATDTVWIAEGDSISAEAGAAPNGPSYQAQYAQSTTKNQAILCQNNAVPGSSLTHLTTRLTSTYLTDRIATAVASGYKVIVTVMIGTNGLPTIAALETYWIALKTSGAKVIACTILPRDDGTIDNTARKALNVQIKASTVPNAVVDLAGDANIGADGAPTAGVYYYDLVHLNAAGHAIASPLVAQAVETLRVSA